MKLLPKSLWVLPETEREFDHGWFGNWFLDHPDQVTVAGIIFSVLLAFPLHWLLERII